MQSVLTQSVKMYVSFLTLFNHFKNNLLVEIFNFSYTFYTSVCHYLTPVHNIYFTKKFLTSLINSYCMNITNILDIMKTNQKKQFLLKGQQNTHIISKHSDRSIVDDGSSPLPQADTAAAAYYTLRLSVHERTSVERCRARLQQRTSHYTYRRSIVVSVTRVSLIYLQFIPLPFVFPSL